MQPEGPHRVEAILVSSLADMLQELGYRAAVRSEAVIESASSGCRFLIHLHPDGWLQFVLALVNSFGFSLDDANEFNIKYRLGKIYIDKENDIVLNFELPLRGDQNSCLSESMTLWDDLVGLLLTTLRSKVQFSEAAHHESDIPATGTVKVE
jgi:Putative bacterial sensory transduction regulator